MYKIFLAASPWENRVCLVRNSTRLFGTRSELRKTDISEEDRASSVELRASLLGICEGQTLRNCNQRDRIALYAGTILRTAPVSNETANFLANTPDRPLTSRYLPSIAATWDRSDVDGNDSGPHRALSYL